LKGLPTNSKTIDTSSTIVTNTLSTTSHDITWEIDTLGQPGDFLYDIWGLDKNNIWALGGIHTNQGVTAIIKWDGFEWGYHSWPQATLYGIYGFNENEIFVVGGGTYGFAAKWNGNVWEEYSFFPPSADTIWGLRAVWGSAPDDVWAVGSL
jgi:hypothetical protein